MTRLLLPSKDEMTYLSLGKRTMEIREILAHFLRQGRRTLALSSARLSRFSGWGGSSVQRYAFICIEVS
jgi:hypothetical protein